MRTKIFFVVALLTAATAVSIWAGVDLDQLQGLPNAVALKEGVIGGGKPSIEALENAKAQGFKTVIDLRTPPEGTKTEERQVKTLGMNYYNVPVQGSNVSDLQVDQVTQVLSDPDNYPIILHCGSGYRVNLLWNLYLHRQKSQMDE